MSAGRSTTSAGGGLSTSCWLFQINIIRRSVTLFSQCKTTARTRTIWRCVHVFLCVVFYSLSELRGFQWVLVPTTKPVVLWHLIVLYRSVAVGVTEKTRSKVSACENSNVSLSQSCFLSFVKVVCLYRGRLSEELATRVKNCCSSITKENDFGFNPFWLYPFLDIHNVHEAVIKSSCNVLTCFLVCIA